MITQTFITYARPIKSILPLLGTDADCAEKLNSRCYQIAQKLIVSLRQIS